MGPAGLSVERALRVAGLVWAVAWVLNIATTFADHPAISRAPIFAWLGVAAFAASWALYALNLIDARRYVGVMATSSLSQLLLIDITHLAEAYLYLTSILNSVVVTAAVVLPRRKSHVVTGLVAAAAWVVPAVLSIAANIGSASWRYVLIAGYYALVDGMAVAFATGTLRDAAQRRDEDADEIASQLAITERISAERVENQRIGRLLHDTVINTLGAIRRGVADSTIEQVRQRCRMDLQRIEDFRQASPRAARVPTSSLHDRIRAVCNALGLELTLSQQSDFPAELSARVESAFAGASTELLINVNKHADDKRVEVSFGPDLSMAVRDFGRGWDGSGDRRGFDLSVVNRLSAVDGKVEFLPVQQGTAVRLEVSPRAMSDSVEIGDGLPELTAPAPAAFRKGAIVAGAWLTSLGLLQTALDWGRPQFWNSAAALAILVFMLIVLPRVAAARGSLPNWLIWLLLPAMAAIVALPQVGMSGCSVIDASAWGPDGAAAAILLTVVMGSGLRPAIAAAIGLTAGLSVPLLTGQSAVGDCGFPLFTVLLIELGTVGALHLYRSRAENLLAATERDWKFALGVVAKEAAEDSRRRAMDNRLNLAVSLSGRLMAGIADGSVDPESEQTRQEAGAQERTLRSLLLIDPSLGALGDVLAEVVFRAAFNGKHVRLQAVAEVQPPSVEQAQALRQLLFHCVDVASTNSPIYVTLLQEIGEPNLSVVVGTTDLPLNGAAITRFGQVGLTVVQQSLVDETLLTANWGIS